MANEAFFACAYLCVSTKNMLLKGDLSQLLIDIYSSISLDTKLIYARFVFHQDQSNIP